MLYLSSSVQGTIGLAEAMDKYGVGLVAVAVILILFITIIVENNKMNKKLIQSISEKNEDYYNLMRTQNEDLLSKLIDSDKARNYDEKDLASIFIKLNNTLKEECRKTQAKTDADSICIYVLHNGMVASHGLPFFKMSCICEWIKKGSGISSRIKEHTGLPLSLFDKLIMGLFDYGEYIIDIDNAQESNLSMFVTGSKVISCYCVAIYDNDNKIMGFIAAEFSKKLDEDEAIMSQLKKQLVDLAGVIKPVLDYSGYNKINNN